MAREKIISEVELWAGEQLPAQYRQFLAQHEETIFGSSVLLYPAEDLIERNTTFETKLYCPGYLAIGDDSGGRAFVIRLGNKEDGVYAVDQGDMSTDSLELVARSFSAWVQNRCETGGGNA